MRRSSKLPEVEISGSRGLGRLVGEAALRTYGAAGAVAAPIAGMLLKLRERRGKENAARRGERLGIAGRPRPPGPLVWVHAASVGETSAALPLIDRLIARGLSLLLTTGTVTAADVAARRLPSAAIHQFAPIDTPWAVARFLDHWRPDLALFAESELWPSTLIALRRRAVPLVVINARMSDRSVRTWQAFAPVARAVLGKPDLFLAQTVTDAARLEQLGARQVVVCGNLKFDVPPPPADETAVAQMLEDVAGRFVVVAASTHPGEESAIIAAHSEVARSGTRLLTILAPRHPERGLPISAEIAAAGFTFARRSQQDRINPRVDIYIADTIGEMGLWYRLADIAVLGGSLVPRGGQNPIEPAKLLVPILHGMHVGNFRDVYASLTAARAVMSIDGSASLAAAVQLLIAQPAERERLAREARACVERFAGALDRTLEALEPYLARLPVRA